ncbi:MAG: metallopeptidase TldD-related protein, partial [Alphaproteobacteria bacterium]|nr:metallopeptidase TldD-related protein [Alphaproteobacteria bacterium]
MTDGDGDLLFSRAGLDGGRTERLVAETLAGTDDGELFLEHRQTESFSFDDGRLKNANFDTSQGFGLRAVAGEKTGYAHAAEISEAAIGRAADSLAAVKAGHSGVFAEAPAGTNEHLYPPDDPVADGSFENKVRLLQEIDAYARDKDTRVRQVSASLQGELQRVEILRGDGRRVSDVRPLVRLNVAVVVGEGDRQEAGSHGTGGRVGYGEHIAESAWQGSVDEALRQALVNLESVPAPAGEMKVVLGPGWPGILLHEAIGHGLEGDFNRKQTSAFAGLMGERVASPGVTVVDDGTIYGRRGSLTIDDEGTPTGY